MIALVLASTLIIGEPDARLERALSAWAQCRWEQFVQARELGFSVERAADTALMLCRDREHMAEAAYDAVTRDGFFSALATERVKKEFRSRAMKALGE